MNIEPNPIKEFRQSDSIWQDIKRPFAGFIDNEVTVTFENDSPCQSVNDFGSPQYEFDIVDMNGEERTLAVSSVRLMRLLKKELPLENRTFLISRSGRGVETTYQLTEVAP